MYQEGFYKLKMDERNTLIPSPKLPVEKSNDEQVDETETPTRSDSVLALERDLLRTSWVKEAELIRDFVPEEDLTKTQQKLIQKCIDKEEFTDKQLTELKLILNKYRKILLKIKPDEAVQQVSEAVEMMESEKDFINLMTMDNDMRLLVHVQTPKGKKGFDFIVEPINDSRVIESLEMQVDLFRDYSQEEQIIYGKGAMGTEKLTPTEQKIYEKMNREIANKQSHERIHTINKFLAHQLRLEHTESSIEDRIKFWEIFPFNSKVAVFIRVQDMLGLSETKNSELFPTR